MNSLKGTQPVKQQNWDVNLVANLLAKHPDLVLKCVQHVGSEFIVGCVIQRIWDGSQDSELMFLL